MCDAHISLRRKPETRDYLIDLGVDGRTVIELILNSMEGCGLDSAGCRQGPVAVSSSEHGTESIGSTDF
jgi:hypothetical protein